MKGELYKLGRMRFELILQTLFVGKLKDTVLIRVDVARKDYFRIVTSKGKIILHYPKLLTLLKESNYNITELEHYYDSEGNSWYCYLNDEARSISGDKLSAFYYSLAKLIGSDGNIILQGEDL